MKKPDLLTCFMDLINNDIHRHRQNEEEKALLASFAATASALSLVPGSEPYDLRLSEHRNHSRTDDGAIKEALYQRGLLAFVSDPSWNSISRDLEGAKQCSGVDLEQLVIALKSFYVLNGIPEENFVVYEGGIGAGGVLEEMANSTVEEVVSERKLRVRDALYVGVSDTLFGNLYALLEKALTFAARDMEESREFIRYFVQSLRNYCYPPFLDTEQKQNAERILRAHSLKELFHYGQCAIPENLRDVRLRQRGVQPLTDAELQSSGMRTLHQYREGTMPDIFDPVALQLSIASFADVYSQRFIQGDFRDLDSLPDFQADVRMHTRALIDLSDNEYADYLLYSLDHLHPGGVIEDDAPKTRGLHKPRLNRFLEKITSHPIDAHILFITKKISGALESVLIQRKCEYADHNVPYPYISLQDLQRARVAFPTHAIVTPEYFNLHGGIAHSRSKDCLADSIGTEDLEEIHVDTLEMAVGQQFNPTTLCRLEEEAHQPLSSEEAQKVIGTFLAETEYDILEQIARNSLKLDAQQYPHLRIRM